MAKGRRSRIRPRVEPNARPYRRGVLVVHGIGNSQPGDTLARFVRSIEAGVADAGSVAKRGKATFEDGIPRTVVEIEGSPTVLMMEAHWANALPALDGFDIRRFGRQLTALMKMTPFLLVGALGPRLHEPDPTELPPGANASTQFRTLAPMLWRLATLLGIVFGTILIVDAAIGSPWQGVLLALIALACLAFLGTSKLIGQVRIAALVDDEVAPALARIRAAIAQIEAASDEVWVIAHSQGGYLSHRVLAADGHHAHPRVKRFTGIASGLRPIHLASIVRSTRWAISGWCSIVGSLCFMTLALLLLTPEGILSLSVISAPLAGLLLGVVQPAVLLDVESTSWLNEITQETTWAALHWTPLDTARLASLLAGAVAVVAAFWVRKGAAAFQEIGNLPARIRWEELTSPSDLVGSMSVPPLPSRVHEVSLPALRNPIGDHLLGLLLRGPAALRVLIAERLIARTSFAANQTPPRFAPVFDSLRRLSHRTYRLRGLLFMCAVGLTLGFPFVIGSSVMDLARQPVMLRTYLIVSISAMAVSAAWWAIGARRHMRSYCNGTSYQTLSDVSPSYLRWLWISAVASVGSAFSITFVCHITGQGQQSISGSLMILGVVLLFSACLAEVQVHVPRPLLWLVLAGFPTLTIISVLGKGDDPLNMIWIVLAAPGVLLGAGCIMLTSVTLFRRRTLP